MADVHEPHVRSYNMSQIRSKHTRPEMIVRQFLHGQGFRYGLHNKNLPGTPDIVLRRFNTVLLVQGCFWHGHDNCPYFVIPKTRTDFWITKIERNKFNDRLHIRQLKKLGWTVITIYECDLKPAKRAKTLGKLLTRLSAIHPK